MTAVTIDLAPLAHAAGLDLASYREEHVRDRISTAITRERVADAAALARLLRADAPARLRFRRSVAVSVSGLFRDAEQFGLLERQLLPPLMDAGRVTVWSAGCADGSEIYSVAILLQRAGALERASLLGSDLLEENLELAVQGVYGGVRVADELRGRTRWDRRDVVREPAPRGLWSLILCRNLAIYLRPAAKRALHEKLVAALRPGGILLLGRSERIADPRPLGLERAGPHAYRRAA